MKLLLISVLLVLGLGGILMFTQNSSTDTTRNDAPTLSMQTITSDMSGGSQLVDVRTPAEYASGHIDGADNLPLQDIQAGVLPTAAKDQPVYVYCRSGNRSSQATSAGQQ